MEWINKNPAIGIELFGPQSSCEPWPEAAQAAFKNVCAREDDHVQLTCPMLGIGTGQRADDCCHMRWHQNDGEHIQLTQDKTNEFIWVACPDDLRDYLDGLPKQSAHFMPKTLRLPLGYDIVFKRFAKVRAGVDSCKGLVPHGWRFTAAVSLAEGGCSDTEIQAVIGHRTLKMVQRYKARANQKRLSKQAQTKRQNKNRT